jgi:hypothetical protein
LICIPNRFTQINKSLLLSVYLLHSKKKWYASSRWTPQAQFGLDNIFDLYKSLFRNAAEHRSWVSITFNLRGPYWKCLGTIFISFALLSNARLNFDAVSRLRTVFKFIPFSNWWRNEWGIRRKSLQKGTIRSLPLRKG